MKYLFGPVNSRRLGVSLGIDLLPYKTCSMDCIYCECGKTTNLKDSRSNFFDPDEIILELEGFFKNLPKLDYVTFSGSGEPTLFKDLKKIVTFIKKYNYRVALLTNATMLKRMDLKDLQDIDLIIPTLNTMDTDIFNKINRSLVPLDEVIKGITDLTNLYTSKIWLEIFVLFENYDKIFDLASFVKRLPFGKIQLNTLDRPGTEDLEKVPLEKLIKLLPFFYPVHTEIISRSNKLLPNLDTVINLLQKRFVAESELANLTKSEDFLDKLLEFRVIKKEIDGERFIKIET